MVYEKQLPRVRELLHLSRVAKPFPATRKLISSVALRWGMSEAVIDFLKLFPQDLVFNSRAEFITKCEELELFIEQERKIPEERLRSPQN